MNKEMPSCLELEPTIPIEVDKEHERKMILTSESSEDLLVMAREAAKTFLCESRLKSAEMTRHKQDSVITSLSREDFRPRGQQTASQGDTGPGIVSSPDTLLLPEVKLELDIAEEVPLESIVKKEIVQTDSFNQRTVEGSMSLSSKEEETLPATEGCISSNLDQPAFKAPQTGEAHIDQGTYSQASSSSSSFVPTAAADLSLTDCPQCGSLCLGVSILPCSHLICRKCLRQHRSFQPTCSICKRNTQLPGGRDMSVIQLVQKLGIDPVMEQLVSHQLKELGELACTMCPDKKAAHVCLDCKEHFCEFCSSYHQRMSATRDHALQLLPQAGHTALSASHASTGPVSSTTNVDTQPHTQSHTSPHDEWNQWKEQQVKLLQEASTDQSRALKLLKNILLRGERLLGNGKMAEQLLHTYSACLSGYDGTRQSGTECYIINLTNPDTQLHVNPEALGRRLRDIRSRNLSSQVVVMEGIYTQLNQMLQSMY